MQIFGFGGTATFTMARTFVNIALSCISFAVIMVNTGTADEMNGKLLKSHYQISIIKKEIKRFAFKQTNIVFMCRRLFYRRHVVNHSSPMVNHDRIHSQSWCIAWLPTFNVSLAKQMQFKKETPATNRQLFCNNRRRIEHYTEENKINRFVIVQKVIIFNYWKFIKSRG